MHLSGCPASSVCMHDLTLYLSTSFSYGCIVISERKVHLPSYMGYRFALDACILLKPESTVVCSLLPSGLSDCEPLLKNKRRMPHWGLPRPVPYRLLDTSSLKCECATSSNNMLIFLSTPGLVLLIPLSFVPGDNKHIRTGFVNKSHSDGYHNKQA